MKNLLLFVSVFGLAACASYDQQPVRTYDYSVIDEYEGVPRHVNRQNFNAVEAAESGEDDICIGPTCNCDAK